jgi:hypothetical protein
MHLVAISQISFLPPFHSFPFIHWELFFFFHSSANLQPFLVTPLASHQQRILHSKPGLCLEDRKSWLLGATMGKK